ncbi:IBR domain containing protein [Histomonas meleagridis]|nr:IBR domain containing protein [Histomonas meleagridis]
MESDILEYCGPEVCKNFKHFLMEDQILRDSELLPCTNPGCQQVLTINCVGPCNVAECSCGKRICWRCLQITRTVNCRQIIWKNLSVMWEKKVKAQAIWEARELALVTHRAKHRDEIQRQNQIQNKELEQHHKELSNEELKEINELEKQIAQHKKDKTYSEEKLEIEQYQLNSLRRTHEVKEKERMKERETVKSEQQSILSMLNDPKHAPFYFRQFLESRQIRALQNVEMTSEELLAKITKKCPKCKSPIEKQGGCNYMRCGKCHYEFCWVCGDSWATHGDHFACNKFDGKLQFGNNEFDIKEQDIDLKDKKYYPPPMNELDRIEYNRFNFYHSRYSGHIQSQKLEKKAREKTLKEVISNLTDMSEKTATEFMKTVFKAIDDARSVLIWSYPKAYLMDNKTDNFHMFEIYQSNMEIAIEKLVGMVERASNKPTYEQYVKFRDMLIKYTNILLNETDMLANHKTRQEYQRKYLE